MARQKRRPAQRSRQQSASPHDAAATLPTINGGVLQILQAALSRVPKVSAVPAIDAETQAALAEAVQAERDEWQQLTGEPMHDYSDTDAWRRAAVRFGLPADKAFSLEFTANDVWDFLLGQKAAEKDRERAAERAALAAHRAVEAAPLPVLVDDEWTVLASSLTGNMPEVLVFLDAMTAHSAMAPCTKSMIEDELSLSATQVDRAIRSLRKQGLVDSKGGRSVGGIRLTAAGRNVVARIPSDHVKDPTLVNHQKAAQTLRRAQ